MKRYTSELCWEKTVAFVKGSYQKRKQSGVGRE